MASTHTQLAALYFQQGEYQASAEQHQMALKIYKRIVAPGQNPMHHGGMPVVQWPDLIKEVLSDLPDVEFGALENDCLPVACYAETEEASKRIGDRLQALPGAIQASLVYHNFEDVAYEAPSSSNQS